MKLYAALPVALATLGLSVCQLGAADGVNVNAPGVGVRVNEEHGGPSVVVGAPNAGVDVQTQGGPAVRVEAPRNAPPRIAGPSDASLIRDNRPDPWRCTNGRTTDGGITDPIIAGCGIPHRAAGPTTRPLAATRQVMAEYRSHQPRNTLCRRQPTIMGIRDPITTTAARESILAALDGALELAAGAVIAAAVGGGNCRSPKDEKREEDRPAAVPCVMHLAPL